MQIRKAKTRLARIILDTDTRAGYMFDVAVQLLIVVSMVSFAMETLPGLSDGTRRALVVVERATVALFSIEYLLRLYVSKSRLRFARSFFGFVDIIAILPFYISTGIDLRWLRGIRLLRLIRVLKLARYSRAAQRFHRAFMIAREEIVLYFAMTLLMLFFAAVGIHHFEHVVQPDVFSSVPHSLWWAVVTLTTVGYGDAFPITVGGRVFTFVILMLGLGVVAVPAGLVSTALAKARQEEQDG